LLFFFRQFVELPAKNQPLLDYFCDISRDWERLQRLVFSINHWGVKWRNSGSRRDYRIEQTNIQRW